MKTQGSYRINPYAYAYELVPAVEVRVNEVGVRSLKVGKDPKGLPADPNAVVMSFRPDIAASRSRRCRRGLITSIPMPK